MADDERDPLERLSEEFLRRKRQGEAVDLDSFANEHPDHADAIRALFPTLLELESARTSEPARSEQSLGRWHILDELGRGGMGVVYLAEDRATGERVALKLMTADHPGAAERFRREANAVARVEHPQICRVVDIGRKDQRLWIAFEHLEGQTVADALRRARREQNDNGQGQDPAHWFAVAEQVARALHATHEAGLVHRDIKPANIMLTPNGRAVVLDFGLVHDDPTGEHTRLTHTGVPVGTPAYMSPEQVHARPAPLDGRTDVYSLGATLYEALTLRPPFEGPTVASLFSQILTSDPRTPSSLNPRVSRDQDLVLMTALEKRADRRYRTAHEFADDLGRAREGRRVRARPVGPLRRLATWAVRNPAPAAVAASITLALATGLIVAISMLNVVRKARDQEAATARAARAQALASASAQALRSDATLSLLLARAAVRAQRSPKTISQLHAAVHGNLERARLTGHGGAITDLAWSGDGTKVVTGCEDGRARLFGAHGTLLCTVPPEGAKAVRGPVDATLSPSASRIATTTSDGRAWLWSAAGDLITRLDEGTGRVLYVEFLDDRTLTTVRHDGRISLHDRDGAVHVTWRVPLALEASEDAVSSIAVSRDPPRLHVLTHDGLAISYDARGKESGRRAATSSDFRRLFDGGRLAFQSASPSLSVLSADAQITDTLTGRFGRGTAFCGADTWWCAWSPAAGATIVDRAEGEPRHYRLDLQRSERPEMLCASPDGDRLCTLRFLGVAGRASAATDPIRLWTPRAAPLAGIASTEAMASTATLSAHGRLALGWHTGGLVTVNVTAPQELATGVPRWRGNGLRYSPMITADGRQMIYLHSEREIRVLSENGSEASRFALDSPVRHMAIEPGRRQLLIAKTNGAVSMRDLAGNVLRRLPADPPTQRVAWVGTGGAFLSQVSGPRIRFHDPRGAVVATVEGRLLGPASHLAFEEEVAIAASDRVRVCGERGDVLREYVPKSGETPIRFYGSVAGRSVFLLRAGRVRTVCRCLDEHGKEQWHALLVPLGVADAPMSRDGTRIVLPASGGLSVRDETGREVAHLRLPGGLSSVAFDHTGTRLVAGSLAGTARVWDRDGRRLLDLPAQGGASMVGFSKDGRRIATITNAMARLHTTDVEELEALAAKRSTRALTDIERAEYARILEPGR